MRERLEMIDENLRIYPLMIEPQQEKTVVLGDLHGNVMKLIYLLLRYGIIHMEPAQFDRLWTLYDMPVTSLSLDDLAQFETILNDARIENLPDLLVMIGDEFADRGQNDFFTALVFKKLHDSAVPYKIHLSNHGSRFLACMEGESELVPSLNIGQECSLDGLLVLFYNFEPLANRFFQLIEHAYKDHLVLIGYLQENDKPLCVLTHAPIDNVIMKGLATRLGIDYHSEIGDNLVECIDQINAVILRSIRAGTYTVDFSSLIHSDVYQVLWNRALPKELLPQGIVNIHGHIGAQGKSFPEDRYINLDSDWGKPCEIVLNQEGGILGVIPADDSGRSPIFLASTSLVDRDSAYYQSAFCQSVGLVASDSSLVTVDGLDLPDDTDSETISMTVPAIDPAEPPVHDHLNSMKKRVQEMINEGDTEDEPGLSPMKQKK